MSLLDRTPQIWQLIGLQRPLILASASPRRAAILQAAGCPFAVIPSQISEDDYGAWDGGLKLRQMALAKADTIKKRYPDRAVLAADTVVVLGNHVLGKPKHTDDARSMLRQLSGRIHEVWSAMCYVPESPQPPRTALVSTRVSFRSLTSTEIEAYVATREPLDKAGAYGIQGIGGLWVQKLEGCYFNVVGLPLSELWDLLNPEGK